MWKNRVALTERGAWSLRLWLLRGCKKVFRSRGRLLLCKHIARCLLLLSMREQTRTLLTRCLLLLLTTSKGTVRGLGGVWC